MNLALKRFTVLGACILALAFIVRGTSMANAETGAGWMLGGKSVGLSLVPTVKVQQLEVPPGGSHPEASLTVAVAKTISVQITCKNLETLNFTLQAEGGGSGKLQFTECGVLVIWNGKLFQTCSVSTNGKIGTISTEMLKALIVLHEVEGGAKEPLVRVEPSAVGKPFTIVEIDEECSLLGGESQISGVFYLQDAGEQFGTEQVSHLFKEGPLTNVIFNAAPTKLAGSAVLSMTGSHVGLKWSGLPA